MSTIGERRAPLRAQVEVVRWDAVRAVCIISCPGESVVPEEAEGLAESAIEPKLEAIVLRPRRRLEREDIAGQRIWARRRAWKRSIDVAGAELVDPAGRDVGDGSDDPPEELLFDTEAGIDGGRGPEGRIENAQHRVSDLEVGAPDEGIRRVIDRIADDDALLPTAIEAEGILVEPAVQAAEEDPPTEPDGRLVALEGRPSNADARCEVDPVLQHVLKFVTDTKGEREVSRHAEVVLGKPARPVDIVGNEWVPAIDGVLGRTRLRVSGVVDREAVLFETGEGVGSVEVAPAKVADAVVLDLEAPLDRVLLAVGISQVVLPFERVGPGVVRTAGRAAAVERVEDVDGQAVGSG